MPIRSEVDLSFWKENENVESTFGGKYFSKTFLCKKFNGTATEHKPKQEYTSGSAVDAKKVLPTKIEQRIPQPSVKTYSEQKSIPKLKEWVIGILNKKSGTR